MAYQLVSAPNQDSVMSQFVDFAIANAGFSTKVTGAVDSGTAYSRNRNYVKMSKGAMTWLFSRCSDNLTYPDFNVFAQMSLNSALIEPDPDVNNTPENPLGMCFFNQAGPFSNVYMFTDGLVVHCAVEISSGVYTHFCVGSITKTETFTGGEFMAGNTTNGTTSYGGIESTSVSLMFPGFPVSHRPNSSAGHDNIRLQNFSSFTYTYGSKIYAVPLSGDNTGYNRFPQFSRAASNNSASGDAYFGTHHSWTLRSTSGNGIINANSQNQRTPMWPNIIRLDDQASNLWRLSGHIPSMRFCYIDYLDHGDIIHDEWQVFPLSQKNGDGTAAPNSRNIGVAYHRV